MHDKMYIAAAGNPHVRLFEINTNNPNAVTSFDGHTGNVTAVGFHREGQWMFTGSEDKTIKVWDLR
jgi:G protein beta subunit-like protein